MFLPSLHSLNLPLIFSLCRSFPLHCFYSRLCSPLNPCLHPSIVNLPHHHSFRAGLFNLQPSIHVFQSGAPSTATFSASSSAPFSLSPYSSFLLFLARRLSSFANPSSKHPPEAIPSVHTAEFLLTLLAQCPEYILPCFPGLFCWKKLTPVSK